MQMTQSISDSSFTQMILNQYNLLNETKTINRQNTEKIEDLIESISEAVYINHEYVWYFIKNQVIFKFNKY